MFLTERENLPPYPKIKRFSILQRNCQNTYTIPYFISHNKFRFFILFYS